MAVASGATRIPSVVAYLILLGLLLGLYRFTTIGLDRVPDVLPCAAGDCGDASVSALTRAPASPLHLLVAVELHGRALSFVLDTGSESTVLARTTAQGLGWLDDSRRVLGAVNDRFGVQHVMSVDRLVVAGRAFGGFDVTMIDMAGIRAGLGPRIDGVLGADVLSAQAFEIDFARPALVLGRSAEAFAAARRPAERDVVAPLTRIGDGWYVLTRADERQALFLIDSGSNATVVGEQLASELGGATSPGGRVLDAQGVMRASLGSLVVSVLAVGDHARRNAVVGVGDANLLGADFFAGSLLRIEPGTETLALRVRAAPALARPRS